MSTVEISLVTVQYNFEISKTGPSFFSSFFCNQLQKHQPPHRHTHTHTDAHTLLIQSVPLNPPPGQPHFCIIVDNNTMHYDIIYIQVTHPWTDKDRMGGLQSLIQGRDPVFSQKVGAFLRVCKLVFHFSTSSSSFSSSLLSALRATRNGRRQ